MSDRHTKPPGPGPNQIDSPWGPEGDPQQHAPDFGKTQPIRTPTVEDVLEIFGHFRHDVLKQIDKRDERILQAIQDIGSQLVEHYTRATKRSDEHAAAIRRLQEREDKQDNWINQLRQRTHKLSNDQQTIDIRLAQIEAELGIGTHEPENAD